MARKFRYFPPTMSLFDLKPLELKAKGYEFKRDKTGRLMYRRGR